MLLATGVQQRPSGGEEIESLLLIAKRFRWQKRSKKAVGIGSGSLKDQKDWAMIRGNLSPAYTTRWEALRVVRG